jgi:nucleoid-associated protein YgaU
MASTRPKIEKAYIQLMPPDPSSLSGGGGGAGGGLGTVTFPFNPKEYTIKKAANWKSDPAKGSQKAPTPEFTGTGPGSITVEVFLDAASSPEGSVVDNVEILMKAVAPLPSTVGQNKPSPPMVVFGWGTQVIMSGIVKSVSVKYTLFKPDGTPIRASASVQIEEMPAPASRQNPTSGGLAARRTHTVVSGDTLASISYREYGRPGYWRSIAEANGIDDPLRLPPGTQLLIPPVEDVLTN